MGLPPTSLGHGGIWGVPWPWSPFSTSPFPLPGKEGKCLGILNHQAYQCCWTVLSSAAWPDCSLSSSSPIHPPATQHAVTMSSLPHFGSEAHPCPQPWLISVLVSTRNPTEKPQPIPEAPGTQSRKEQSESKQHASTADGRILVYVWRKGFKSRDYLA